MRKDNIVMLEGTLEILDKGYYIKNNRKIELKLSKAQMCQNDVLLPQRVNEICDNPTIEKIFVMGRTGHFCVNSDSFSTAIEVKKQHPKEEVLVLNFANPVYPGGGVRNGANAQEEDLCRKSSLLMALEDKSAGEYYDYNDSLHTYMGSDAMIVTPNVEIIKDEKGNLLDDSVLVSVITCAAPMISKGLGRKSEVEYKELLYNRIMAMLKVAAHYRYKYLVLGAWGCGAFGNDAEIVAELFYKALHDIRYNDMSHESLFRQIYFSVLDRSEDKYNFNAFYKYFDFNNFYREEDLKETNKILQKLKGKEVNLDKIMGSLVGGAVGDALGYPVEFYNEADIEEKYGKQGITEYELSQNGKALISDDTQMTLFTANGIMVGDTRQHMRGVGALPHCYVGHLYREWKITQEITKSEYDRLRKEGRYCKSWLCDVEELYNRRAPGNTCLSALDLEELGSVENPINSSKGCGGIMRVAPLALYYSNVATEELDKEGAEIAALTHGHSLGYMPAAVFTHIISRIIYPKEEKKTLKEIVVEAKETTRKLFEKDKHIDEVCNIIDLAMNLSENEDSDINNIHKLGEGWVAEETLAIAIYCSLKYKDDFSKGIIAAVNHKGDSDSTGAVTGNILGALLGYSAIEDKWKNNLELLDVIQEIAVDLCHGCAMSEYGNYRDLTWITKYINARRFTGEYLTEESENVADMINSSTFISINDALRKGLV